MWVLKDRGNIKENLIRNLKIKIENGPFSFSLQRTGNPKLKIVSYEINDVVS